MAAGKPVGNAPMGFSVGKLSGNQQKHLRILVVFGRRLCYNLRQKLHILCKRFVRYVGKFYPKEAYP